MYEHGGNIYQHKDCVDFSSNINCLGMPDEVRNAMKAAVEECWHYPDPSYSELKAAIAKREGVEAGRIICANGATELIFLMLGALPKGRALLFTPSFFEFERALKFYGWDTYVYPLQEKNGFEYPTPDEIMKGVPAGGLQLAILCNPGNPTGQLINRAWLRRFIATCQEKKIMVLLDECFMDFASDDNRSSLAQDIDQYDNLLVIKSFTKFYALAGIRLGFGLTSNNVLFRKMSAGSQPWSVNMVAQSAGIAACSQKAFDQRTRDVITEEKKYMKSELQKQGITVFDSAANFLFIRVPENLSPRTFGRNLMKRGFLLRDCSNFRGLDPGCYRITMRNRVENMDLIAAISDRNHAVKNAVAPTIIHDRPKKDPF